MVFYCKKLRMGVVEFGAALKQKMQLTTKVVMLLLIRTSLNVYPKVKSNYLRSGVGFPSARDNNLFQLHLGC